MKKNVDIYEHLAKVYLGTSGNKKKNSTPFKLIPKVFLKFGIIAFATILAILLGNILWQNNPSQSKEAIIVLSPNITKIDFQNFNLGKKEIRTFDLKDIDFLNYKTLLFSARKSNHQDRLLLVVELIDRLGKQSKIYIDQLPAYKWRDFEIKLAEFKGSSNMSEICLLAFVVEEWKTREDKAVLYIDKVSFLK